MTDEKVIKAIETEYAGCRFRSRLEARWAVFFDALGIDWEYEPQGFETSGSRYLPDFWLEELQIFVEVKGRMSHADFVKTMKAAYGLVDPPDRQIHARLLFLGPVPRPGATWCHTKIAGFRDHLLWSNAYFDPFSAGWALRDSGAPAAISAAAFDGVGPDPGLTDYFCHAFLEATAEPRLIVDPAVDNAYRAARAARFEFGERG